MNFNAVIMLNDFTDCMFALEFPITKVILLD